MGLRRRGEGGTPGGGGGGGDGGGGGFAEGPGVNVARRSRKADPGRAAGAGGAYGGIVKLPSANCPRSRYAEHLVVVFCRI